MRVIFVCQGNTCRSPMAEVIFKSLCPDVEVISAGFSSIKGEKASRNAIEVCHNNNLNLSSHVSKSFYDIDIKEDDLILTLTSDIRDSIRTSYPDNEVYTIREYAGEEEYLDINDPTGGDVEIYEICFCEILENLKIIVKSYDF